MRLCGKFQASSGCSRVACAFGMQSVHASVPAWCTPPKWSGLTLDLTLLSLKTLPCETCALQYLDYKRGTLFRLMPTFMRIRAMALKLSSCIVQEVTNLDLDLLFPVPSHVHAGPMFVACQISRDPAGSLT